MTLASYKAGRELLQSAAKIVGAMSKANAHIEMWKRRESAHNLKGNIKWANRAAELRQKAIDRLEMLHQMLDEIKFPDNNIPDTPKPKLNPCINCGKFVEESLEFCTDCTDGKPESLERAARKAEISTFFEGHPDGQGRKVYKNDDNLV